MFLWLDSVLSYMALFTIVGAALLLILKMEIVKNENFERGIAFFCTAIFLIEFIIFGLSGIFIAYAGYLGIQKDFATGAIIIIVAPMVSYVSYIMIDIFLMPAMKEILKPKMGVEYV